MTSLTQALPLIRGIDNQICFLIINYFLEENVWTKQVFYSAQYAYDKDDLATRQRPSISCIPIRSHKNSFDFGQTGRVKFEIHVKLKEARINLAQKVIQIANLIQLINLNQELTKYAQLHMPGLFWIGKECDTDYSRVYANESVVTITMDFKVDLKAYQRGLQRLGYDITSPDEVIYSEVQTLIQEIDLQLDYLEEETAE